MYFARNVVLCSIRPHRLVAGCTGITRGPCMHAYLRGYVDEISALAAAIMFLSQSFYFGEDTFEVHFEFMHRRVLPMAAMGLLLEMISANPWQLSLSRERDTYRITGHTLKRLRQFFR
jgi:hypothetical protein